MGRTIERGQCVVGLRKLNKITHISVQTLRTCLTRLKSTHEITLEPTNKYTIVTICNYDLYQNLDSEINTQNNTPINIQSTFNQQTTNKQLTTSEEEEEDQEGKEPVLSGKPDGVKEKKVRQNHYHPDCRSALWILNETSGKRFRETDANLTIISARLAEDGVDLPGIRKMIERQCQKWKGTSMADFLRPETLFGKQKFDGYYANRDQPIISEDRGRSNPRVDNTCKPLHSPEEMFAIQMRKQEAARMARERPWADDIPPATEGNGGGVDAVVP